MRTGRILIIAAIALVLGTGFGALLWLYYRDPLSSLPQPQHQVWADRTAPVLHSRRSLEHITLHNTALGDIGITVSLPNPLPDKKLPILVVLGGLGTGENNIRYITDAGDNAIVGYDWPMPVRFYGGLASLTQISDVYNHVMAIPAQVPSAIRWLSAEPWADRQRISILGFSLGALAAPAIQDVAEHDGQHIGWTILAYGGAPFGELVAANPHIKPGWVRPILASAIDLLLRPLQPTRHLAQLSGQFLVLEGHDDLLIPKDARARLRDAVPAPKTVMELSGDHMGVGQDKVALLQQIIVAGRTWLVERGAVDPL